jgi:hypothetical protein
MVNAAMASDIDPAAMTAFTMAFAKARDVIRDRKQELSDIS